MCISLEGHRGEERNVARAAKESSVGTAKGRKRPTGFRAFEERRHVFVEAFGRKFCLKESSCITVRKWGGRKGMTREGHLNQKGQRWRDFETEADRGVEGGQGEDKTKQAYAAGV